MDIGIGGGGFNTARRLRGIALGMLALVRKVAPKWRWLLTGLLGSSPVSDLTGGEIDVCPSSRRWAGQLCCALWLLFALEARADIVIAQVSSQQGNLGFYTKQLAVGAQAYFQAVNARGGVGGERVRFVSRDDGGDPERTIALYKSIATEYEPVAFLYQVGPASIVRLLESGTLDELQIPLLGTLPAVDSFRRPVRPYVFYLRKGDEFEIAKIARHLTTIGNHKVAVLNRPGNCGGSNL